MVTIRLEQRCTRLHIACPDCEHGELVRVTRYHLTRNGVTTISDVILCPSCDT